MVWREVKLTYRNNRELRNEKFRLMIESSGIRRAGHEAHMLYGRLMMEFVRKTRSKKNHLGDVRVV
jgi:hypothetical protein